METFFGFSFDIKFSHFYLHYIYCTKIFEFVTGSSWPPHCCIMESGNINHVIFPFTSELQIAEESWESYLSGDKSLMTGMHTFFEYFF